MDKGYQHQDLLRFTTAGSVDDGKSTLIGRLLLESKAIFADQLEAIERESKKRGDPYMDLALFTDGLKAEREQKITIDVAYRYFATPKRKFIIADCPGHIQYTRNMVTGASTAEVAVVLVDARKGVVTQSKRHAFISTLLEIPHILVAINKMDLVDFEENVYQRIVQDFQNFATKLEAKALSFIPISALHGDNVIDKSPNMPWYNGATLLHYLESVNVGASKNLVDFRFPVQYVIRPNQNFRGFAGRIASGRIKVGDEILSLPSGAGSRVAGILRGKEGIAEAFAGDSVVVRLDDEIDVSRGDMLVRKNNLPQKTDKFDVTLCWLSELPLNPRQSYLLRLGTRETLSYVARINYRIDVDTMHREEAEVLALNDIGRVQLVTSEPMFFDSYKRNRESGSFLLIDSSTHITVAAGMIRGASRELGDVVDTKLQRSSNVTEPERLVSLKERESAQGHAAAVIWLTGLSGSGKSTIAKRLEKKLFESGNNVYFLDGDSLRTGLNSDLRFAPSDRSENIRRAAEVAALAYRHGALVICAFISPFQKDRDFARSLVDEGRFLEVFIHCPLEVCKGRDPKGLYRKVERGEIKGFTGVDSPYESPTKPDLLLDTAQLDPEHAMERILQELSERGILGRR